MNGTYLLAVIVRARASHGVNPVALQRAVSEADRALAYSEAFGRLLDRAAEVRGNPDEHARIMAAASKLTGDFRAGQ